MVNIAAFTIDGAWRQALQMCYREGYRYEIEKGSYEGETRIQLPAVAIEIRTPYVRPLTPYIPPHLPPVTSEEKIENYFKEYLIGVGLKENEQYTYGSWIVPQLERVISNLIESHGNTNQAAISIGDSEAVTLDDPPCLRVISFKCVPVGKTLMKLNVSVFFRSWDLVAGFPQNLGGIQLLKEYVLGFISDFCVDGAMFAYSDGLHIYYPMYKPLLKELVFGVED